MNKTAGVKNYAFFFMKHDSIVVEILMIYIYIFFSILKAVNVLCYDGKYYTR